MSVDNGQPTWLVTGASGFLGANMGAFLQGRASSIGLARSQAAGSLFDFRVAADLTATTEMQTLVERIRPDVIVHAAALSSHEMCEQEPQLAAVVNVEATSRLAAAAAAVGAKFIFVSTDAVFDGTRGNYAETDEPNPTSVYGRTKLAGEQVAVAMNSGALVLRTNFFGWSPSGRRSILEFFVNSLAARTQVRGFTDFRVSSLYIQSLVASIWRLTEVGATGVLHVAAKDSLSKYEFGMATARQFNLDDSLITPTTSDMKPPRGSDLSLDVRRAESLLGFDLPTSGEGITRASADQSLRSTLLDSGQP